MGISLKKFINDYTPAGALYKAATGGGKLTDDAGKAWSKAVDDTGISKTVGDTAKASYDASPAKLITTGSNTITDAAGDLWSKATDAAGEVTNTVTNTVTNVKETIKETTSNVVKGVTGALPIIAIGGAVVLGLSLLLRR